VLFCTSLACVRESADASSKIYKRTGRQAEMNGLCVVSC